MSGAAIDPIFEIAQRMNHMKRFIADQITSDSMAQNCAQMAREHNLTDYDGMVLLTFNLLHWKKEKEKEELTRTQDAIRPLIIVTSEDNRNAIEQLLASATRTTAGQGGGNA
jgi:hypothetical protein